MNTQRVLELVVGMVLVGYCAWCLYTGRLQGKFRQYDRSEDPFSYWSGLILTFAIGLVFLYGTASWRR